MRIADLDFACWNPLRRLIWKCTPSPTSMFYTASHEPLALDRFDCPVLARAFAQAPVHRGQNSRPCVSGFALAPALRHGVEAVRPRSYLNHKANMLALRAVYGDEQRDAAIQCEFVQLLGLRPAYIASGGRRTNAYSLRYHPTASSTSLKYAHARTGPFSWRRAASSLRPRAGGPGFRLLGDVRDHLLLVSTFAVQASEPTVDVTSPSVEGLGPASGPALYTKDGRQQRFLRTSSAPGVFTMPSMLSPYREASSPGAKSYVTAGLIMCHVLR
ncbi:hypothetical protein EXIGLDRAFT_435619 [Exidia glandulosa HHB12029]|uniref:Uncharacterized protein n=1 Tax=Exidia glandulosa HHB12029 TaxID=1314781 RepID=A0A165KG22_EXIGL|nr:hypothetical protein EXIGLDRAFT_435619 [Exidia glandulosa HHB12029]